MKIELLRIEVNGTELVSIDEQGEIHYAQGVTPEIAFEQLRDVLKNKFSETIAEFKAKEANGENVPSNFYGMYITLEDNLPISVTADIAQNP